MSWSNLATLTSGRSHRHCPRVRSPAASFARTAHRSRLSGRPSPSSTAASAPSWLGPSVLSRREPTTGCRCWRARGRRLLSAVLDTAPVAVYVTDANGRLLFESADYSHHTGLPASAWWPDELHRVVHPLDVEMVGRAWENARDSGTPLELELRLRGLGGHYRWFLHRVVPIAGPGPHPVAGWVGTSTDIDAQKQVETSLREQQEWFQSVANGLPVVIWVTLPDGTLEFLSQRWYELTGQDASQADGTGWTQAIHPEDLDRVRASFVRSVEEEGVFDSEYRLRRANGEYVWVLDRGGTAVWPRRQGARSRGRAPRRRRPPAHRHGPGGGARAAGRHLRECPSGHRLLGPGTPIPAPERESSPSTTASPPTRTSARPPRSCCPA